MVVGIYLFPLCPHLEGNSLHINGKAVYPVFGVEPECRLELGLYLAGALRVVIPAVCLRLTRKNSMVLNIPLGVRFEESADLAVKLVCDPLVGGNTL